MKAVTSARLCQNHTSELSGFRTSQQVKRTNIDNSLRSIYQPNTLAWSNISNTHPLPSAHKPKLYTYVYHIINMCIYISTCKHVLYNKKIYIYMYIYTIWNPSIATPRQPGEGEEPAASADTGCIIILRFRGCWRCQRSGWLFVEPPRNLRITPLVLFVGYPPEVERLAPEKLPSQ